MTEPQRPHHEVILEATHAKLRNRFGSRVWGCKQCDAVLGVFNEDFTALEIASQRVNMTIAGGQIQRTCYRCDTVNQLATRGHDTVASYLKENDIRPVYESNDDS